MHNGIHLVLLYIIHQTDQKLTPIEMKMSYQHAKSLEVPSITTFLLLLPVRPLII